jgi:hypothetical protein
MAMGRKRNRQPEPALTQIAASHPTDGQIASLDLWQLTRPVDEEEQLAWIELRGTPDYLDLPAVEAALPDGRRYFSYAKSEDAAKRREVQRVYEVVFSRSKAARQKKLLRSFAANFPQVFFEPGTWSEQLWQICRSRFSKEDQVLLAAIASGIKAKGWGQMSTARARSWRIAQARRRYAHLSEKLRNDEDYRRLYNDDQETRRAKASLGGRRLERRSAAPLLAKLREITGFDISIEMLDRLTPSVAIRREVARVFDVRERNLH